MPEMTSRRTFLRSSTALGLGLAATGLLADDARAQQPAGANDKIVMALIGSGGRGTRLMRVAAGAPNVEFAMVCDVYEPRLQQAREQAGDQCVAVREYQRVLDNKDVGAVIIATPDHWHRRIFLDALQAGKDIYCEKPMSKTIEEGREMVDAAQATDRVVQIGTHRRSGQNYPQARKLVEDGKLGVIHFVRAYDCRNYCQRDPFAPPKDLDPDAFRAQLDWEAFQGSAPRRELDPHRYFAWRWFWDYAGGLMTDVGVHVMDIVHLITAASRPRSVVAHGAVYELDYWQTPDVVNAVFDYGSHSVALTFNFTNGHQGNGIMFYGSQATMEVRGSAIFVYPEQGDRSKPEVMLPGSPETELHVGNFLSCVRSREKPNAPVELGHSSLVPSHLANIAYRQRKMVTWDAEREQIAG